MLVGPVKMLVGSVNGGGSRAMGKAVSLLGYKGLGEPPCNKLRTLVAAEHDWAAIRSALSSAYEIFCKMH
jgi:hypothetical protein